MATYLQVWDLSSSSNLHVRAAVACAKAAIDVLNESPITTNHANRVKWAESALLDPESEAKRMMWGLISNATIQASGIDSTDNDIQFTINGLIDTMSARFA